MTASRAAGGPGAPRTGKPRGVRLSQPGQERVLWQVEGTRSRREGRCVAADVKARAGGALGAGGGKVSAGETRSASPIRGDLRQEEE